jgi:hypothetical protein
MDNLLYKYAPRQKKADGLLFQEEVWKAIRDPELLQQIEALPMHNALCKLLDESEDDEIKRQQLKPHYEPTLIRHSCCIVVTTDGRVLLRSKKGNDFTQVGNGGGGSDGKTFSHLHFAMRNGVYDEYGIGFNNRAVKAMSTPIFTFECPHKNEAYLKEPGSYLVYTIMVLDEREIVKLDDPIIHGPPDTPGD